MNSKILKTREKWLRYFEAACEWDGKMRKTKIDVELNRLDWVEDDASHRAYCLRCDLERAESGMSTAEISELRVRVKEADKLAKAALKAYQKRYSRIAAEYERAEAKRAKYWAAYDEFRRNASPEDRETLRSMDSQYFMKELAKIRANSPSLA